MEFMTRKSGGINHARLYVFFFQKRKAREDGRSVIPGSQHIQNVFNGYATPPQNRLTPKYLRI